MDQYEYKKYNSIVAICIFGSLHWGLLGVTVQAGAGPLPVPPTPLAPAPAPAAAAPVQQPPQIPQQPQTPVPSTSPPPTTQPEATSSTGANQQETTPNGVDTPCVEPLSSLITSDLNLSNASPSSSEKRTKKKKRKRRRKRGGVSRYHLVHLKNLFKAPTKHRDESAIFI